MTEELDTQTEEQTQDESTQNTLNLDEALDALKKARGEAASHRVAKKQAIEEKEALKSQFDEVTSKVQEYESKLEGFKDYDEIKTSVDSLKQENHSLKLKTQLAGKVIDVDKALKLVDESYIVEGQLDVDKFLEENSFLASKPTVTNPAKNSGTNSANLTNSLESLQKMSQEDRIKYFTDKV